MTLQELQKMTVVKLRQEAMQHGGINGVSGMSKAELVEALAERCWASTRRRRRERHRRRFPATSRSSKGKSVP